MPAVAFATSAGTTSNRGAATDTLDDTYLQAAIEATRLDIAAVPGSGDVRGVFVLNSTVYAIRDNVGGTAGVLHKATTSGWEEQDLGDYVDFTAGTAEFLEGETLTGGTSGATATIEKVVLTSGTWGSTAAGYLVLSGITGTFQAAETGTSSSGSATLSGAQVAHALSPGGQYSFITENFGGTASTRFAYGCNGLDYGFEWTGSVFSFIRTGSTPDTPEYVLAHRNHLFWAIGPSLIFSAPGEPMNYTAATAGEIATGANIRGLIPCPGGIMNVFARDRDGYLFGSDSSDFEFKRQSNTQGGIAHTGQLLGSLPVCADEMGVIAKNVTDQFGDFKALVMSEKVQPLLKSKLANINTSGISTSKGLYRIFYDDKTVMTMGINQDGLTGFFPCAYDREVVCYARGEDTTGEEVAYFGSADGFVYQLDKGTSFDGREVVATLRFAFNHCNTPQNKKRFFVADIEMIAPDGLTLLVTPDFSYADPNISTSSTETLNVTSGGGFWDFSTWGSFNWSEAVVATGKVHIRGTGTNVSLLFYSSGIYTEPHTVEGYTLHYSVRGMTR